MEQTATNVDDKKLKKTISLMRKAGVLKLKTADFDIELSPMAIAIPEKHAPESTTEEPKPQYSEEDILFWSTPGLGEGNA